MNRRVLIVIVVALAAVLGWRLYQQSTSTQPTPTAPADTASATAGEASGETPPEDTAETAGDAATATEGTGEASLSPETATDVAGVADALAGVAGAATDTASATDAAGAATGTKAASPSDTNLYLPEGYALTPFVSDAPVREFSEAGDGTEDGKDYRAVLETTAGRMVLDLYEDETPVTVNSFVWLARNRYYDGIAFHRVVEGFVVQGGDPNTLSADRNTWGQGGPGYEFGLETREALRFDGPGVIGMARTQDPDTNGSQFYITLAPTPNLDGQYTVFGRVVEGEDVLGKITRGEPPENPTRMERVYIVEKDK